MSNVIIIVLSTTIIFLIIFFQRKIQLLKQKVISEDIDNSRTSELINQKQKIEELLSLKQKEIVNLSHEFKTPLALILGPAREIAALDTSQLVQAKIDTIQRNATRLLRMVDQLLKLETFRKNAIAHKSVQDFKSIIEVVSESFVVIAKTKGIKIDVQKIEEAYFEFVPDALETILLNLISNAIKYSSDNLTISVTAKKIEQQQYVICISDMGIGISEKDIPIIFDRFQRIHNENSERVTGAGIGLALVKEIVELHNGRIEIDSVIGKGTEFKIYLPIIGESQTIGPVSQFYKDNIAQEIVNLKNINKSIVASDSIHLEAKINTDLDTILVIEDNIDMQVRITECLSSDYNCMTASNGKQGVDLAKKHIPDMVISDVMMPILDGYQVTKAIKENDATSHIPVILLSVLNSTDSRMKGWEEKADAYFPKPIEVDELKIRVQNLLKLRKKEKQYYNASLFKGVGVGNMVEAKDISIVKSSHFEKNQQFLNKLEKTIESLYQDSELKVDVVATKLCMSQRQLLRKLKNIAGLTPLDYLRRFRVAKAKELLAQGVSASQAGFDVGFSSHSHFGKIFKEQYGYTPSEFINTTIN